MTISREQFETIKEVLSWSVPDDSALFWLNTLL